jgi:hypothetical protein
MVVALLAVVGAGALVVFLVRTLGSSARVLRAANLFQVTSVEAINAIHQAPENELRQLKAIQRWEGARSVIRSLTADEQRIVVETLRDRAFPTAEVGEAIGEFMAAMDEESGALDEELVSLASVGGRRA